MLMPIETPDGREVWPAEDLGASLYREFLASQGHDTAREGLRDTPRRHTAFLSEFCAPQDFNFTTFESEGYDEMIIQKGIPFYSLCEHHVVPFFGVAIVAYIPRKRIVGLSKLARAVEYWSRGLQNQERITKNVARMIEEKLKPKGVAVSLKARHLCMEMRGVKKPGTETITTSLSGAFKKDPACRAEFMAQLTLT